MATVNKNFVIKNGLIVQGSTATVNGNTILTEDAGDTYILNLVGGATLVKSVDSVFTVDNAGNLTLNYGTGLTKTSNNLVIDRSTVDTWYDEAGAAASAQSAAESYADSQISSAITTLGNQTSTDIQDAITTAENYTDSAISQEVTDRNNAISSAITTAENYADTAASNAQSAAENYTDNSITSHNNNTSGVHGVTGDVVGTTDSQTISNKTLGNDLAAGGYKVSGLAAPTANSDAATKLYVDTAISDLVDGAPALLDTLNELAAAIADNPNYASDVANLVATKADTTYVDSQISAVESAAEGYANTAEQNAKDYADTVAGNALSVADSAAQSYANTAQSNAEDYADQVAGSAQSAAISSANSYTDSAISSLDLTAQGYANTAQSNAESYTDNAIDALSTSDIEEGTNLYYTAARAKAEAATLLANATKTNIVITKDGSNNLTITAENGVADSTTDNLVEGSSNLYFTNARAVSALEAVTPDFPAVEIANIAKQVAAQASVATASTSTGVSWAKADYKSAEFLVKIAQGSHTEVSKVILTLDTSDNVAITEYAMVGTNGSLGSVSADVSGSDVRLRVATLNNNSTVAVVGTLLK